MKREVEILKVPEGLIKRANEKNILADIIFWYQLKSFNTEGRIYNGNVQIISSYLNISVSSYYRKIKRLTNLGFIGVYKNFIQLISYDRLFSMMGYEIKEICDLELGTKIINRLSCKIFKIKVSELKRFVENVIYQELLLNYQRQAFAILKQIKTKGENQHFLLKAIPKKILGSIRQHLDLRCLGTFEAINEILIDQKVLSVEDKCFNDFDISLSCLGISQLLGFKAASTGLYYQQVLEKFGWLTIERRKHLLEANPLYAADKFKEFCAKSFNYVLKSDMLYYYNTNKFIFNY